MNILRKLYSLLADTGIPITSVVPGTGATNLGKARGSALTGTDTGVLMLATTVGGTYYPLHIIPFDDAFTGAPHGLLPMAVRKATPANTSGTDGDYEPLQMSAGGLWTRGITPIPVVVTFSLDTNAYADGDLLADTQAIAGAVSETDGYSRLVKVDISDEDAQGIAMDIVILRNSTSLGTENNAPNITDANLRPPNYQGLISVAAADWKTISGAKVTTWTADGGKGMLVIPVSGGTSVHAALIARGAGTFTASGIVATFWFARD